MAFGMAVVVVILWRLRRAGASRAKLVAVVYHGASRPWAWYFLPDPPLGSVPAPVFVTLSICFCFGLAMVFAQLPRPTLRPEGEPP
jgi:hypothetical protein